jgi:hypothetical protein
MEENMTTSEEVKARALDLARADASTEQAVRELLVCCGDRRVPVVLARQHLLEGEQPEDSATSRAVEYLDEVLGRLPTT